jgi:hypothetical protein
VARLTPNPLDKTNPKIFAIPPRLAILSDPHGDDAVFNVSLFPPGTDWSSIAIAFFVIGSLAFIPGSYSTWIAYATYRSRSHSPIPLSLLPLSLVLCLSLSLSLSLTLPLLPHPRPSRRFSLHDSPHPAVFRQLSQVDPAHLQNPPHARGLFRLLPRPQIPRTPPNPKPPSPKP